MSNFKEYKPSTKNAVFFYVFFIIIAVLIFVVHNTHGNPHDKAIRLENFFPGLITGIVIGGILFLNQIGVRFYIIGDKLWYTPTIFAVWFPRFKKFLYISELKEITYIKGHSGRPVTVQSRIMLSPPPYEMILPFTNFKKEVWVKLLQDLKKINPKITFDQGVTDAINGKN